MSIMQRSNGNRQPGTEIVASDGEVLEYEAPAVLGVQIQSEIEAQVAVARKYPRSIKQFTNDAMALATLNLDIAKSCIYSIPRGGKPITGPSVRLAEIVAACYGNLRVVARVLGDDTRFITAQATCLDVQRNIGVTIEVRRKITDRNGKTFNEDMIGVTGAAAVAIARRNAIFAVIPNAFTQVIYGQCCLVAQGGDVPFQQLRDEWIGFFVPRKVSLDRLLRGIGCQSIEDMTVDHVNTLIGYESAIKEGDTTLDQAFPREPGQIAPPAGQSKTSRLKEELKAKGPVNPDGDDPDPVDAGGTEA